MACFIGSGVASVTSSRSSSLWSFRCMSARIKPTFGTGIAGERRGSRCEVRMASSSVAAGWGRTATEDELKTVHSKLYVYDHCPFCVKCRMVFGLRKDPFDLVFLANDDARTPTRLIGKKILPILQDPDGEAMGESLDIITKVEGDSPILKPATGRKDIPAWQEKYADVQRKLVRARTSATPLAEFQSRSARTTYETNHPMPDGSTYAENLANTPSIIPEMQDALKELEAIVHSEESVSEGGFGYDDLDIWPRLRALTMVKGLEFPPKLKAYVESVADRTDIPLYYYCAS